MRSIEELKKILTEEECESIYRMLEQQYRCDDARTKILDAFKEAEGCGESLCVGEGKIFTPAKTTIGAILKELYAHPEELVEKATDTLGNNDSYWESYWMSHDYTRDDMVNEMKKQFIISFAGKELLRLPDSEVVSWQQGTDLRLLALGEPNDVAFLIERKKLVYLNTCSGLIAFAIFGNEEGLLRAGDSGILEFPGKPNAEVTIGEIIEKLRGMKLACFDLGHGDVADDDIILLDAGIVEEMLID